MKYFGVFALIVVVCLSVVSCRSTTFGSLSRGDVVLARLIVDKKSKVGFVVSEELKYGYNKGNRNMISYINAVDQDEKGKGGPVSILAGGPGSTNVTLKFKSLRSKKISYVVVIHGRNATRHH